MAQLFQEAIGILVVQKAPNPDGINIADIGE